MRSQFRLFHRKCPLPYSRHKAPNIEVSKIEKMGGCHVFA